MRRLQRRRERRAVELARLLLALDAAASDGRASPAARAARIALRAR